MKTIRVERVNLVADRSPYWFAKLLLSDDESVVGVTSEKNGGGLFVLVQSTSDPSFYQPEKEAE